MKTRILLLFTRTPLHVGAGSSVGAIDQPIQRERHTGFPVIPGSSLKGSFADLWNDCLETIDEEECEEKVRGGSDAAWLFGSDNPKSAAAGSLLFGEARVLAFPVRSAKGGYAWITCPMMLKRARRDGVLSSKCPAEPSAEEACFKEDGPLALTGDSHQIVLEDYCFSHKTFPQELAEELSKLINDELFCSVAERLVVVSDGTMSHFVTTACDVAQHVRISDETGTAEGTGLFNQENVPSETLFYASLAATSGRGTRFREKTPDEALEALEARLKAAHQIMQFGGDASTGLGFCSVELKTQKGA